jgi:ribonuclease P protein component
VAYSVNRRVGTAVVRNRVRRRLRAVMQDVSEALSPGQYLVAVAPGAAELTYRELRDRVLSALGRLEDRS